MMLEVIRKGNPHILILMFKAPRCKERNKCLACLHVKDIFAAGWTGQLQTAAQEIARLEGRLKAAQQQTREQREQRDAARSDVGSGRQLPRGSQSRETACRFEDCSFPSNVFDAL